MFIVDLSFAGARLNRQTESELLIRKKWEHDHVFSYAFYKSMLIGP